MADNIVLAEMTWTEVEVAAKDRPVALLPVGPTQAHGPHLPVSTDSTLALEVCRRTAAKLRARGIPSLILPAIPYGVAALAADFPGTVSVSSEALLAIVRDVCTAAASRCRAVGVVNLHIEAAHLEALRKATDESKKAGVAVCFTDITKKRWAEKLGAAFLAGDHAGSFETSLLMAAAPDSVREKARISLPPMDGLNASFKGGAKTFGEAGGEDAYFGDPTSASAEEGEMHLQSLGDIFCLSIMEHLGSKA